MSKQQRKPSRKKTSVNQATESMRRTILFYALLRLSGKPYHMSELARIGNCTELTALLAINEIREAGVAKVEAGVDGQGRYVQIKYPPGGTCPGFGDNYSEVLMVCRDFIDRLLPNWFERAVCGVLNEV